MHNDLGVVLLAGGKRTLRTDGSNLPKLLEPIGDQPVLGHILDSIRGITALPVGSMTAVISSLYEEPLRNFFHTQQVDGIAVQETPDGTAGAVWTSILQGVYPKTRHVLVLMGDQPLITSENLDRFIIDTTNGRRRAGILTFWGSRTKDELKKCGVVYRDEGGRYSHIQTRTPIPPNNEEEMLHAGPYLFETSWLKGILTVTAAYHRNCYGNAPEWHLYEALDAARANTGVEISISPSPQNFLGVDTLYALEEVRQRMLQRHQS